MTEISLVTLLEGIAAFDESGGASLGLAAWELCVEEPDVSGAWTRAITDGLLRPSGRDDVLGEELWRLTAGGWAALRAGD